MSQLGHRALLALAAGLLLAAPVRADSLPPAISVSGEATVSVPPDLAEIPVDQEPKNLTKAMSMGKSPEGKALKFVHRGSYENMDNTYEAITNHLEEKKLEAKDTFIEEYITDPLKTAEDKLVINVYVPLK